MTRKQLWIAYAITIFMMVWGLDTLAYLKIHGSISFHRLFSVFIATQIIYTLVTLHLTVLLFRRFFPAKKFLLLFAGIIGLIIFFILMRFALEEIAAPTIFNSRNYPETVRLKFYALDNIYYAIVYIMLGFLIFLLDNQFRIQREQAELVQKNREAELQFLRSQINPHFLFNTLNNIYSLIYDKSDKAPEATLQLSEMMRYTLYEKQDWVPLIKEWKYIQSFIELQQLRFDRPIASEIKIQGLNELPQPEIAPYILIPFIENAFKHGDLLDINNPVKIELIVDKGSILFAISNKIGRQQKDKTGGVGLENVKRRLELIYPANYNLEIHNDGMFYSVNLSIEHLPDFPAKKLIK